MLKSIWGLQTSPSTLTGVLVSQPFQNYLNVAFRSCLMWHGTLKVIGITLNQKMAETALLSELYVSRDSISFIKSDEIAGLWKILSHVVLTVLLSVELIIKYVKDRKNCLKKCILFLACFSLALYRWTSSFLWKLFICVNFPTYRHLTASSFSSRWVFLSRNTCRWTVVVIVCHDVPKPICRTHAVQNGRKTWLYIRALVWF